MAYFRHNAYAVVCTSHTHSEIFDDADVYVLPHQTYLGGKLNGNSKIYRGCLQKRLYVFKITDLEQRPC